MKFQTTFSIGQAVTAAQIHREFGCSLQGGMCRSLRTNTLCLISKHIDVLYEDRWEGDVLYYTGMGQVGDQQLDAAQNKTLHEFPANGVEVHLFEVFSPGQYLYRGRVMRIGDAYPDRQPDRNGALRRVWIFPLRLLEHDGAVEPEVLAQSQSQKARAAHRKSDAALRAAVNSKRGSSGYRNAVTRTYSRDPEVAEYTKRRAHGICQLCGQSAPFCDVRGEPYLESHHIQWRSKGGPDVVTNTAALCPNCHAKMHLLDLPEDRELLRAKAQEVL